MVVIQNDNFSVEQICLSGQCFRMNKVEDSEDNRYSVIAFGKYLEVYQMDNNIYFDCTQEEYDTVWKNYFDMDTDYKSVIDSIDREDVYLTSAAEFGSGIRILNQDLWEMIISFIISQQNNIKRIRKCITFLCEKYGEKKISVNGIEYYDFPTAEAISKASIDDLNSCNLGYRSRYIYQTANSILHNKISLNEIMNMKYVDAKTELLKLCGVGNKVADCICLFALHQTEAFPKDTHINKVLAEQYSNGFPFDKYGENSGILQQYIFFYDLNKNS